MAKKTNYLTELIDRHERWKAEGGERLDEEERNPGPDLCVLHLPFAPVLKIRNRSAGGDPDDLWDFGTVRHVNRPGTIGRTPNPIPVSGPPLTWENDGTTRTGSDGSTGSTRRSVGSSSSSSGASFRSSLASKGELPPLPPTPTGYDQQATVRMPSGGLDGVGVNHTKEPSDEFDDYGDQYADRYMQSTLQQKVILQPIEDDVPDTTMLDSVVLPAIASVSLNTHTI
jgi:serine/threonine-protein kinase 24/25/MST4